MTVSVCEVVDRGVVVQAHEAVAIALQLIDERGATPQSARPVPPSLANVYLAEDGRAFAANGDAAPSIFEVAVLLQAMLPAGPGQVPGALRYAIARGQLAVQAPPFASLAEFARSLERFERGDRRLAVRGVLDRFAAVAAAVAVAAPPPRDVDSDPRGAREPERDFDLVLREASAPAILVYPVAAAPSYNRLWAVAAALVVAVALGGVASVARIGAFRPPVPASRPAAEKTTGAASATREVAATTGTVAAGHVASPVPAAPAHDDTTEAAIVTQVDARGRPIFSPAFASDGAAIFFHTGRTDDDRSALAMATGPIDGADLRIMTILDDSARNYHVQPSPDGQLVAFDSDRDGERAVYIANRDGSAVRRISGPGYAAVPTWSPDGTRLAYIRAEPDRPKVWNVWLHALDSDRLTQLTHYRYGQPWTGSWFPDGRRICYTHEDKIVLMDLETRRTWTFDSPVKGRPVRTPAVSPDGTRVVFQVARDGVWILDLSDRAMRRVLADPTAEEFAWAPDGHRVAFHSRRDGHWGIYILHQG